MLKLTHSSSAAIFDSLKGRKNPCSRYCSASSGYLNIGDSPVCMAPSADSVNDDGSSIHSQMLKQFRTRTIFGHVAKLFNNKYQYHVDDVPLNINLYLR
jgi:hypothetical protein